MPSQTLTSHDLAKFSRNLKKSDARFFKSNPGSKFSRQPVHVVYGGAHLFSAQTFSKLSQIAQKHFATYAATPEALVNLLGIPKSELRLWQTVHARVDKKLSREAVEDFRIDFEDGYGIRTPEQEDKDAVRCAEELASVTQDKSCPPFVGIRIKSFSHTTRLRSARTLDLFVSTLLTKLGKKLPNNFVVTLPKVQNVDQVKALDELLVKIEKKFKLASHSIGIELMIESPQALIDPDGLSPLRSWVKAAHSRCRGVHLGNYDLSASLDVAAHEQTMDHPSCLFAKQLMQFSLAGSGVMLSDGATTLLPLEIHRGNNLSRDQLAQNKRTVQIAWKLSAHNIESSLKIGLYQGWDLHPAQIPIRYAVVFAFFLKHYEDSLKRLCHFLDLSAQARVEGNVFDDAATGQGLLAYFLRGLSCGALTRDEAFKTGLTLKDFESRSFESILLRRT